MNTNGNYCISRFNAIRRKTRVVNVGKIPVGGNNPIRLQSMTNTLTTDIDATVKQAIALIEAGCEIVRVTAPNAKAAKALKDIRQKLWDAKIDTPLVADIHFLPQAAMEAVEHVEKIRVNPGNYADKKKFAVQEYTDTEYLEEIERLHDAFSPLVKRAKELGRSIRIGTNHGSLSDRIMNRYGDTPLGMVESALEFARIAESHGYKDLIFSFKASNTKVMLQAYRLSVEMMAAEGMDYPLHLGVTEAGDGEDGRIKSAIGIGSLLYDGIGDTIRVSLTEDPVYEIPVANDLAKRAMALSQLTTIDNLPKDNIDPYIYKRREIETIDLGFNFSVDHKNPPRILVKPHSLTTDTDSIIKAVCQTQNKMTESKIEGLVLPIDTPSDLLAFDKIQKTLSPSIPFFALDLSENIPLDAIQKKAWNAENKYIISKVFNHENVSTFSQWLMICEEYDLYLAIDAASNLVESIKDTITSSKRIVWTASQPEQCTHAVGTYRLVTQALNKYNIKCPIWLRCTKDNTILQENFFTARLIESSIFAGNLLCDGIGDMISIETEPLMDKAVTLGYNILQGTRLRMTKTEFVACPSCGRTLFDLETTTKRIKAKTGHLKGVTIAVMGCIVNGPGEMADADFGYVGGAPGKVNLYIGKECVKYHIPENEAVERLIDLIREHDKWVEPELHAAAAA